jgi:hypothetical protein
MRLLLRVEYRRPMTPKFDSSQTDAGELNVINGLRDAQIVFQKVIHHSAFSELGRQIHHAHDNGINNKTGVLVLFSYVLCSIFHLMGQKMQLDSSQ